MIKKIIIVFAFIFVSGNFFSQKGKVQTAWRALNDYEVTVKDGKPDINYLTKAKDAIDLALANPDTKNQGKTHAYKCRISYEFFKYNLKQEVAKLETVQDKNERAMQAYGNVSLTEFESANEELAKITELDPKFMANIQDALLNGTSNLEEDDVRFAMVAQQMKMESANIAQGKYKAKKYDEAADYFYKTGVINTVIFKEKDTANFFNACVSAAKSKSNDKIIEYNKKMIDLKIASNYNYGQIYNANIAKKDTSNALEILKKGRIAYPNDMTLVTLETDLFLAMGKPQDALNNIKYSMDKDPKNPLYYLNMGNIYDKLANPKDKNGQDLEKPANFEELFRNAETNYLKAIELKPASKDQLYYSVFSIGALYNNYGGTIAAKKYDKITDVVKYQKENEAKSKEYFKKAIPYLEQALSMNSDDKPTMVALRKLYMITGDDAKAKEMNEKLKTAK
jgi:hypothetical protein